MNRVFKGITLAAAAALVSAFAIACGDSSDADPGLSRAEVVEIARSEMASAAEPGLTREDVAEIAQATVAMATADSLTSADVEAIARETMSDMVAMTPGDGGLTRADVDAMIEAAVAEIPPPVPAAPGLTAADVERIVQRVVADIPQAEPGLTAAEVEKIARAALPVAPPPIPADPSLSAAEVEAIARGVVADIPYRSNPAAYTEYFVDAAIARYEANGLGETLDYYNTRDSVDGQWYAFIIDEDDLIIGHYNPEVVGLDLKGPIGTDVTGYNFGLDMIKATEEGKWVSYIFLNPDTGELESKHSWVVKHDGLLFGSGWYTDPASYTKFFVDKAIALYEAEGLEAAIEYHNDPENIDGPWYMGILRPDGVSLSHYDPEVRGQNIATGPLATDVTGYNFGAELLDVDESGKWISHVYTNPTTGEFASKHSWVILHDGLLFGSGWYAEPASYTEYLVEAALEMYEEDGLDAVLETLNTPDALDGQWYVFVVAGDGEVVGHFNSEVRGDNINGPLGTDVTGYNFGADFLRADEGGKWISYIFHNPAMGELGSKHSLVVKRDGLLFGSGWYTDPDSYTQHIVSEAIERYESEGPDATVAHYSDPDNIDGQWYVVILDTADETILAHYNPEVAGQSTTGPIGTDINGYEFGAEMLKATEEGIWVEFVFMHPVTGTQEDKRSWAVRHDGLVFTTGWYPVASDRDADPGEFAKSFVEQALAYFAANGREVTLARYNSPESMDGDWYVFILQDREGDLYTVAHASRPDLVGTTRERIDASGFNYGEAFAAVTEAGGGEWVSYLFTHPTTREDAPKHTWVERRGDLLFGAGWYEK